MNKRITIKDIAREAGVSPSAVSLVLNNQPCRIAKDTRQIIMETARKYNYKASPIARSMVTKKTNTLGVIVPDIENVFFSSLVKTLESFCHEHGYLLIIVNSDDQFQMDLELYQLLSAQQIDGLFLVPSNESFDHRREACDALSKLQMPIVLIDRIFEEFPSDKITFDNRQGAYDAVCHLIQQGHKKIGCITISSDQSSGKARLAGYLDAMKEHNLTVQDNYMFPGDYRIQSGYEAAVSLYSETTAVFSGNDMMALGFLRYLSEQGVSVPDEYSVIGYDDVINSYLINLELTSVAQKVSDIGSNAFRLMQERLKHPDGKKQEVSLKPKLIVRGSVAPPIRR